MADQTFTITADNGWYISEITVDGEIVEDLQGQATETTEYIFSDVSENHTITATFYSAV